jgi:voltage-gated potassium channel
MTPGRQLALALASLLLVTALGTAGFVLIEGASPLDALFMTVITLSTVGYNEVFPLSGAGRLFTVGLILTGLGIVFYAAVSLVEFVLEGRLRAVLGRRAMKRAIDALRDHVILCGYGRFGRTVAEELERGNVRIVVVDREASLQPELEAANRLYVLGSALDESVLEEAGVKRARAVVAGLAGEADNVFVTLSAREANAGLTIHARGETEAGIRRLRLAGANQVISPYHLGGLRIANAIVRPGVVDFIELSAPSGASSFNLEEIVLAPGCELADIPISDVKGLGVRVVIVAIKRDGEPALLMPQPDDALRPGDRVVVVGEGDGLRHLAELAQAESGAR